MVLRLMLRAGAGGRKDAGSRPARGPASWIEIGGNPLIITVGKGGWVELRPAPYQHPNSGVPRMWDGPLEMTLLENPEVPLGPRPAPSEARSVAAKLSCAPGQGSHLASPRDTGIFRAKMRAGPVPPVSREGRATSPGSQRTGEGASYQFHVHPAVSSHWFWFFQSIYPIQTTFLLLLLSHLDNRNGPESTLPISICLLSLSP